jgi:hypothetical protein
MTCGCLVERNEMPAKARCSSVKLSFEIQRGVLLEEFIEQRQHVIHGVAGGL